MTYRKIQTLNWACKYVYVFSSVCVLNLILPACRPNLSNLPTPYKSPSRPEPDLRMRPSSKPCATFCNMLLLLPLGVIFTTNPQAGRRYIFGCLRRLLQYTHGYTTWVSPPPFASDEPPSCTEKVHLRYLSSWVLCWKLMSCGIWRVERRVHGVRNPWRWDQ